MQLRVKQGRNAAMNRAALRRLNFIYAGARQRGEEHEPATQILTNWAAGRIECGDPGGLENRLENLPHGASAGGCFFSWNSEFPRKRTEMALSNSRSAWENEPRGTKKRADLRKAVAPYGDFSRISRRVPTPDDGALRGSTCVLRTSGPLRSGPGRKREARALKPALRGLPTLTTSATGGGRKRVRAGIF